MNAVAECSDDGIDLLQCVTDILGMRGISDAGGRTKMKLKLKGL